MLIIRGVNVFPTQVEELILKDYRLAPHYQLEVTRDGHLDSVTVNVEVRADQPFDDTALEAAAKDLQHHIKSFIGISTRVNVLAPNSIERSMGKARRVIDKRPKG